MSNDILKAFERLFPNWKGGKMEDYDHHTIKIVHNDITLIFEYHSDDAYYLQAFPTVEGGASE